METKNELIKNLIEDGYLKTPNIIEAFRAIDRADFVLPEYRSEAYGNYPLPITGGQTISQPLTVAFMLELLEPQLGEKILDIGAGSGWQTTLLAEIIGAIGVIVAIERIPELCDFAQKNIDKYGFIKRFEPPAWRSIFRVVGRQDGYFWPPAHFCCRQPASISGGLINIGRAKHGPFCCGIGLPSGRESCQGKFTEQVFWT